LGIQLLCRLWRNEHITTHDTLWNIVVAITSESGTHMQKEVSHLFPHHAWRWMDIVITRSGFWTLVGIVIVDPTLPNLVQHVLMSTSHAMIVAAQNKAQSYTKWMLGDDFIPLTIEAYICLDPHFDSFVTSYVHACITCH
jgi:hypothetical protein